MRSTINRWVAGLALLWGAFSVSPAAAQTMPTLPNIPDISCAPGSGITTAVPSGGNFQTALNNAMPGDTITLAAGATYTGSFTLPNKAGSSCITIRTSAPDSSLPAAGTRITPSYSSVMPKLVSPGGNQPVLLTAAGAHHYQFIGVEFVQAPEVLNSLVVLGDAYQTSLSAVPHHIVLDRVYIHGVSSGQIKHCLELQSASTTVKDSYIADCKAAGADAQAIVGYNGPGPFRIINNWLEGSGENVMFGGADPRILNLVPSDIEIKRNTISKPLTWMGGSWSIKNLFELKNAQRVLVDGNLMENNWAQSQAGFAVQLTVRNQDGTAPWSVVQDITFTNNIVRHTAQGINFLGTDNAYPSQQEKRLLIKNNVLADVGAAQWGGGGRLYQILYGAADVTIDHNTAFQTGSIIMSEGPPNTNFYFRNNIQPHGDYGVSGTGTGDGMSTLNTYFPNAVFTKNVIAPGSASSYPPGNYFSADMNSVGFVNLSGGDYHLAASSPYKNAGTDGKDLGADIDALTAAMAGSGSSSGGGTTTPPPPPPPPPTTGFSLTPTSLSFGSVAAGSTSTAMTATVTNNNTTGAALTSVAVSGPFAITSNTCLASGTWNGTLGAGTHCDLSIVFKPTVSGSATGTLTVIGGGQTYTSALSGSGTGTAPPPADTTAPTVSITTPAGGATVSGTATVSATASDNVGVVGVQFKLDGVNYGAEVMAAPYTSSWNTTGATNGSHALTAVARDAAGNTKTSAAVTVTVSNITTPPPPPPPPSSGSLSMTPASLSFGSVAVGSTSAESVVQVFNNGTNGSSPGATTISGPFAITKNYCAANGSWNGTMGAATHCDIYVVFKPTAGGAATGSLTNKAGTVALTGTATGGTVPPPPPPPAPAPSSFTQGPASLSFGSVTVGTTSAESMVQVFNTGTSPASIGAVTASGPFTITKNYVVANGTWNGMLGPGTHCEMYVVYKPTAVGAATGTLTSGAGSVALSGTGK